MLEGIGLWAGGIIVGIIAKQVLPKWINRIVAKLKNDAIEKAEQYLKDPEWRSIILSVVLKVQKDFVNYANKERRDKAIEIICKTSPLPDVLERPIIEAMIDIVIKEVNAINA